MIGDARILFKDIIVKLSSEFFEAAVIVLILYYVIFPVKITGDSMLNTLKNGDRALISRAAAFLNIYNTDDIVVIKYNSGTDNIKIVKRIVASEGDSIIVENGNLYINGVIKEGYECFGDEYNIVLKEGEYFVLGDNPQNSIDSRYFGVISKKNITGVVILKFYPFDDFEFLLN